MIAVGRLVLIALASSMLLGSPVDGQDRRRDASPQDRQELERRLRAQMGRMIQERLELSDTESEALTEVMERFQQERRSLARSERETRRRVEALIEGNEDQAEAEALLGRLVELREEESRLFRAEQAALLEVLTPVQVLKLHEVREDLARRMRSLRGRRGGGGDRDGPSRPGGTLTRFMGWIYL
ncbi:MAG: Spy/CpxP family protein refolding chaperone [Gemmatimonadota bacterium]|nr:Spy/CpxP family protein refolding chaperone [Gemmatimonadota bacterium]